MVMVAALISSEVVDIESSERRFGTLCSRARCASRDYNRPILPYGIRSEEMLAGYLDLTSLVELMRPSVGEECEHGCRCETVQFLSMAGSAGSAVLGGHSNVRLIGIPPYITTIDTIMCDIPLPVFYHTHRRERAKLYRYNCMFRNSCQYYVVSQCPPGRLCPLAFYGQSKMT